MPCLQQRSVIHAIHLKVLLNLVVFFSSKEVSKIGTVFVQRDASRSAIAFLLRCLGITHNEGF